MMLLALINIIGFVISIFTTVIIVQFVFSMLIIFNVISLSNQFVASIYHSLNAILNPFLKPIRRIMPDTGMLDLSPMVLIFGLYVAQQLLAGLARDMSLV
jgi:YggT family protein